MRQPEALADDVAMEAVDTPLPADAELIDMSVEPTAAPDNAPEAPAEDTTMDLAGRPKFAPAKSIPLAFRREQRKVPIPPHRLTPLKSAWPSKFHTIADRYRL